MHDAQHAPSNRPVVLAIGSLILVYGLTVYLAGPEVLDVGGHSSGHGASAGESETTGTTHDTADETGETAGETADETADETDENGENGENGETHAGHGEASPTMPHYAAVLPFVLLLGAIAIFPLLAATQHWWESNRNRFLVALALALVTLVYYFTMHAEAGPGKVLQVLEHALVSEYIPFIVLLFSLYVITGGIRIQGDLIARPSTNAKFLIVGGLLASFVGTTGAAMLLIRPLIDTNDERKHVQHTIVFFIFVVCNCGGCLLPIGDPPLFLGYLKGVSFLWTMQYLWLPWLVANALIILIYYFCDRWFYYPKESRTDLQRDISVTRPISITGLWPNLPLLLGIIFSIALLDPTKSFPGTEWHPWPMLREVVQLGLVFASLLLGSQSIRVANRFNYHAIVEVAALFIGIFVCMQPAIEILHVRGGDLGLDSASKLYWATGGLSAVLDNAPTYVVFFETAAAEPAFAGTQFAELVSEEGELADRARQLLMGISLGAVFMGAMTYIGNGPNFMVRAIAEQSGVRMPSFFGYVFRYSLVMLIPVFFVISLLFLY